MNDLLYAYAGERDGKYYAVTNNNIEGPFDTWAEADRRVTPMFKAAQQDPEERWRHGTAGLAWHVERVRRRKAWEAAWRR